ADVIRGELHWSRSNQRHQRDDVIERLRFYIHRHAGGHAAFQLEYAEGIATLEKLKGLLVLHGNVFHGDIGASLLSEIHSAAKHGERLEAEEVHFEQAELFQVPHRPLSGDICAALARELQRHMFDERI